MDDEPTISALAQKWLNAAKILNLAAIAPFSVHLPTGACVDVDILLRNFGAPNGMLLVTDDEKVWEHRDAIVDAGFGFSVLSEPESGSAFVLEDLLDVLRDWGWTGRKEDEPAWLNSC